MTNEAETTTDYATDVAKVLDDAQYRAMKLAGAAEALMHSLDSIAATKGEGGVDAGLAGVVQIVEYLPNEISCITQDLVRHCEHVLAPMIATENKRRSASNDKAKPVV